MDHIRCWKLTLSHVGRRNNTLSPERNGWHFTDDIFKCIYLKETSEFWYNGVKVIINHHWFSWWLDTDKLPSQCHGKGSRISTLCVCYITEKALFLDCENLTKTWVRSWRCGSLVTWFCYQLVAKPGNKRAAPSWPDPYTFSWCCPPYWMGHGQHPKNGYDEWW